jgi:hypothetical protein
MLASFRVGHVQDHAFAHAHQVDPFLTVILAIIDSLDREAITERLDRIMEGDAMVAPVCGGLRVAPPKLVIPEMY